MTDTDLNGMDMSADDEHNDFWLTRCFIAMSMWLQNACIGIVHRAVKLIRDLLRFIWRIFTKTIPEIIRSILRMIGDFLKFIFGRKFLRLVEYGVLSIALTVILAVLVFWPFYLLPLLYEPITQTAYIAFQGMNVELNITWARLIGVFWMLLVAIIGAWKGIKGGYWAKIRQNIRLALERYRQKRVAKRLARERGLENKMNKE